MSLCYLLLSFGVLFLAGLGSVRADFESAGCSDEGCGIPCYLKPPGDDCHYTAHDPCNDNNGATDLDVQLSLLNWLNESLVRLQEKLIQKNIIPAGNSCPSMKSIDNGGVIYTDLILSIGVIANYVCFDGFSLHGHGTYECSTDNQWIRTNDQSILKDTQLPTCEDSVVVCDALVPIPSGHISYQTVDTTVVQPGDVAYYACDTLYTLQGSQHRICLRNGSWSGGEPLCIAPPTEHTTEATRHGGRNKTAITFEVLGPIAALIILAVIIIAVVTILIKRRKRNRSYKEYDVIAEDVDALGEATSTMKLVDESEKRETSTATIATIKPENK